MKKLPVIFLLPLILFSCQNSEKPAEETSDAIEMERNYWANAHLLGKVKMIEETPYLVSEDGSAGEMDSCCIEIEELDENGFYARSIEKDKEGNVTSERVMARTETGKVISNTVTENGKVVWKREIIRNEDGVATRALDTDTTGLVIRVHKPEAFNDFNQALSGTTYLGDSTTYFGKWSWDYIDGQVSGNSWVDSSGVQRRKRTGEVNDKGWISKVVDVKVEDSGDTITLVETYTYDSFDEMGNWTQRTEYNDDKAIKILKRTYTYY